jgi:hypothetical protein
VTTPTSIIVAASTATTASSASSAHDYEREYSLADVTIGLIEFPNVTIGLL